MIGRAMFPRLLGCDLPCTGRGGGPKGAVLRGGAFNNNERNVRCAYRNRNNPNNRNNNIGFRVVCGVPRFSSMPEMSGGATSPTEA
jgi:hypothetical protein